MNAYDILTNKVIEQLDKGVVPWRKPWKGGLDGMPKNLISQKEYRGINPMLLSCSGFSSPYWLTYNQAKDIGGHVKAGEKGSMIIKALYVQDEESDRSAFRGLKTYHVFNVEQCELPEKLRSLIGDQAGKVQVDPIPAAEAIVANMPNRPRIDNNAATRKHQAFYSPSFDYVQIPHISCFDQVEEYYGVLFHELGHSTKHESRVGRRGEEFGEATRFGDVAYSKEELVAEMTATYLCGVVGIENVILENSASYIAGWLSKLKSDKTWLLKAASAAQKAADYIRGINVKESALPLAA